MYSVKLDDFYTASLESDFQHRMIKGTNFTIYVNLFVQKNYT